MGRFLVPFAVGLVGAIMLAATASADRGLPRRYSADAFFETTSGCVHTFVGVYPVAFIDRKTGGVAGASMSMQLEQFDVCTNTFVLQAGPGVGVVFFSPGEFEMSPGLNKASLQTSVSMHDSVSGRDFRVSIELSYRAVEPRSENCSVFAFPEETTTFCNAVVEGVVSDGTTNFTPDPGVAVFQEHRPL